MEYAGVSAAPTHAAVMYVAAAALMHAVVQSTVSTQPHPYSYGTYLYVSTAVIFNAQDFLIYFSVYEAGKIAKAGQPPQIAIYPPYYGVPMVPQAAPSLIELKVLAVPPSLENNTARGQ